MSDDELVAWLFDPEAGDWPVRPFEVFPGTVIRNPATWRVGLRVSWNTGDPEKQAAVLRILRRLREILG